MMTRTINHIFADIEDSMSQLDAHPQGHPNRTAYLEMLAKKIPLFYRMTVDLAYQVQELSGNPPAQQTSSSASEQPKEDSPGQYL